MSNRTDFDGYLDAITFQKGLDEKDNFLYIHDDGDKCSFVIHGNVLGMTNTMIEIPELKEIFLLGAAYIIKRDNIDFKTYTDGRPALQNNVPPMGGNGLN